MKIPPTRPPNAIARLILGLIYPPRCQICGKGFALFEYGVLCDNCAAGIKLNNPPFCKRCGIPGEHKGGICEDCNRAAYHFSANHAVSIYDGMMRECIHKFKYKSGLALEGLFADLMSEFAGQYMDMTRYDWLAPVPLHSVKERERSFNQSLILSVNLSKRFGIPVLRKGLVRVRPGRPQMTLSKEKRLEDIKGAFKIKDPRVVKDRSVLIVDDVFTTGATANECSRVLKEAGAGPVEVFTLARSA